MATKNNALAKVGVFEVVTSINTIGVLYLWYEMQKMGEQLTTHMRKIALFSKVINSNINIVSQHFKAHLIHHKNVLDVNVDQPNDNCTRSPLHDLSKNELIERIEKLEQRMSKLEQLRNQSDDEN